LTLKTISQFYFDTSTTQCYDSIFQSSSILLHFLSQNDILRFPASSQLAYQSVNARLVK